MKLPGGTLLPSLDLRDPIDATVMQCILYFALPNQCQRFGHFVKNCPCVPIEDGKGSDVSRHQSWSEKVSDLSRSSNLQSKSANGSVNQKNQATMGSGEGFKASGRVLMSSPAHSGSVGQIMCLWQPCKEVYKMLMQGDKQQGWYN
jgi:hypothetical protein